MFANDLLSRKAIGLYIEHTIELELGSVLRAESLYQMSSIEPQELKPFLQDLQKKFIRKSRFVFQTASAIC